jgi:hypothetical protein
VRGDSGKEPGPDRIAQLVRQLGDEKFARRKAAGKELEAAGARALPALRQAAVTAPDEEVRRQAGLIVRAILRPRSPFALRELEGRRRLTRPPHAAFFFARGWCFQRRCSQKYCSGCRRTRRSMAWVKRSVMARTASGRPRNSSGSITSSQ